MSGSPADRWARLGLALLTGPPDGPPLFPGRDVAGRLETLVHGNRAMMADVSHQLRTPLAALRLRLDLLAQDADQSTAHELTAAQGEIARLSRLVDGLLAVARAENVVPTPVAVDVAAAARERGDPCHGPHLGVLHRRGDRRRPAGITAQAVRHAPLP